MTCKSCGGNLAAFGNDPDVCICETEETGMAKYPDIEVALIGSDGNAFAIIGTGQKALRRGGVPPAEIVEFVSEATSGDYDHVLQTALAWVEVV